MQIHHQHFWDVTPRQAKAIQNQLRSKVILDDQFNSINTVAGVDVGFENGGKITRAAIIVLEFPSLELIETAIAKLETSFPYVPGLLSFRELPAVLKALQKLRKMPDLLLCDGQGYAHPRRMGIACHLGVLTELPSIGVGKTRLTGQHIAVEDNKGAWQPLTDKEEVIGAVLRTRQGVKPIFISSGHKISLQSSIQYVMSQDLHRRWSLNTRDSYRGRN